MLNTLAKNFKFDNTMCCHEREATESPICCVWNPYHLKSHFPTFSAVLLRALSCVFPFDGSDSFQTQVEEGLL